MNVKQIGLLTDAAGAYTTTARLQGEVLSVALVIGDLSTPDIAITDTLTSESIFSKTGIASTDSWHPRRPVQDAAGADLATAGDAQFGPTVCYGSVTIVVAGGGASKRGTLYISYRG